MSKLYDITRNLNRIQEKLLQKRNEIELLEDQLSGAMSSLANLAIEEDTGITMEELHFDGDELFNSILWNSKRDYRKLVKSVRKKYES